MASNGNIYRGIQLIIDVIDYKMLKGKYLVGMLSSHPMRLIISQHDYKFFCVVIVHKYVETNPNRYLLK